MAGEGSEAGPQPPGLAATAASEHDPAPTPEADPTWAARIEAAAIIAFSLMWVAVMFLAERGLYGSPGRALEVNLYRGYAENVLAGQVPYRDFALEYPPLVLVPILGPLLFAGSPITETGYRVAFELVMAGIGMVTMIFVMRAAGSLDLGRRAMLAAAALVAASPLLLGPLMLARYDLWPALFGAATMWLFIVGRYRLSAVALGLAVLAKVYPIVLAPLLLLYLWRRDGLRAAVAYGVILAVTVAIGLAPFLALAPEGILNATIRAFQRPLQVESLGASILYAVSTVTSVPMRLIHTYDSYNLAGSLPTQVATIQTVVLGVAILVIAGLLLRGHLTLDRLILACAAALTAYVAFGKVFSPQYLMWLIAPLAIVGSRRWPVHLLALALAIVLTGLYYPRWYNGYYILREPLWVAVVLARNLVLAALTMYLVARLVPRGKKRPPGSPGQEPALAA